jgi:serine/threonine-protein kinase
MISCPSCRAPVPEGGRFCPGCGAAIVDEPGLTRTSTASGARAGSGSGWLSSSDAVSHGRFAPGAMLTARYRIVGRLGHGGMGEVYRADDLTLGQPVALKFLPPAFERDASRLAQLHAEVRMARQVSHANVCRVYDIGEADGTHFISMEYVDGEDLGSLLRRIGRLPEDKAVEIARQICAGVAAAHDRGVLHRDLKPANVMLDGRGAVRITDFGLASAVGSAENLRAGTPAYMAPEQLAGREATERSDLYALGLVLYELFTGRRVFEAADVADLLRRQEEDVAEPPSALVSSLDPAIDRAVMRCLARDPAARPASARAVAASLPGGDPLAAALAAGETPSPEMVAAASGTGALSPARGLAWLAAVAAGLILLAALFDRVILFAEIPPAKPPAVLLDRAQEIAGALGYAAEPADTAFGTALDSDMLRWADRAGAARRRALLQGGRPPALLFWYRASPRPLVPLGASDIVDLGDPPGTISGMRTVLIDGQGRLLEFQAVPPQVPGDPGADAPRDGPDWAPLFAAADLPMGRFTPVAPEWTPRAYADRRAAWEGPLPGQPDVRVRVEAAAFDGRVVSFQTIGPWSRASRMQSFQPGRTTAIISAVAAVLVPLVVLGSGILARRNVRAGRGDRGGALRVAGFIAAASLAGWAVTAHHVPGFAVEIEALLRACGAALLAGGMVWLLYLALEPAVRRTWPDMLIGWTRLLAGGLRDPRVGRDVLIGVSAGVLVTLLAGLHPLVPPWLGLPAPAPHLGSPDLLLGAGAWTAVLADVLQRAARYGMLAAFVLVVLRRGIRHQWAALAIAAAAFAPLAASGLFESGVAWLDLGFGALLSAIGFAVALRYGLLAIVVTFFVHLTLLDAPLTLHPGRWYASPAAAALVLVGALAAYGFYASRAGQPLLGNPEP